MKFNYSQICSNLLKDLPEKQKTIINRRYGLKNNRRETLELIGKDYGITRERVRQIEKDGFSRLESKTKEYQKVFSQLRKYLEKSGGLKKEDVLLEELGGKNNKNQIYFLLNLGQDFERYGETEELHPLWVINHNSLVKAKKVINSVFDKLQEKGKPLPLEELKCSSFNKNTLNSYLEASKKIQKNQDELFGLKDWPEINPKGIKDKAYLFFKKKEKPLHFKEVADSLDSASVQTVHNELIKDPRFTLVGRGIYALAEWGYEPGYVKDVIAKVLRESKRPLNKEEVLEEVLKRRMVKENTVLLNLSNRNYFQRDPKGHYIVKET